MTANLSVSVMAGTYAREMMSAIDSSLELNDVIASTDLELAEFRSASGFAPQLQTVATLNKGWLLDGTERTAFYTNKGGWDTHNSFDLDGLFGDVDFSIDKLAEELKAQGRWQDTVVVVVSEFARTLRSNGAGTDHGWGGNAFIAGGAERGGRIPSKLSEEVGEVTIDQRGRLVPTTPWEAMWKGVMEWYGADPSDVDSILPNVANFPASALFSESDLFQL